ncbi:MAG: sulfotransferase family protein [Xanthomonas sp.]|nr:sulfotransferase family protein [Xanthomonas sp.]
MTGTVSADKLWMQGETATDRKQWSVAEAAYLGALKLDPRHVPSLIGLSTLYSREGKHVLAHEVLMRGASIPSVHPGITYGVAQRLRFFNEFDALERCLADTRFAESAPPHVLARAVVMLGSIGAHEAAVRLAERTVQRDPNCAPALYVRGNLHLFSGEPDMAELRYEQSLKADPRLYQNAWMLASVRTQTPESNHVDRLRRQLAEATPGKEGEVYLGFGLHKELHDIGDHAGAWSALQRGCRVKRTHVEYSPAEDASLVDDAIATFDAAFLRSEVAVEQPAVPIFILGMHRSGTTLLERMLSGHSNVADAGETGAFDAQVRLAADHHYANRWDAHVLAKLPGMDMEGIARGYAESARWLSRGKPFFTEKLPMNFWNIGLIAKALPQARIINLVRDPMDTCFSNLRTLFAGVATYSYDQAELAHFYLQYRRLMQHWLDVLPGRILQVNYDELVSAPDAVGQRVAEYCGLSYQASIADVSRSGGRVATASAALARQGIRRDRGMVWRHYEAQLQPLRVGLSPLQS